MLDAFKKTVRLRKGYLNLSWIVFIAVLVASFAAKTYAVYRHMPNIAVEDYKMVKILIQGGNPYHVGHPYNLGLYLLYGIGVLVYDSPYAIKLMNSLFGWLDGVLLYFIHRQRNRENFGFLSASLLLLTYGYLLMYGYFGANDTIPAFFVLLSYYLWERGNGRLGILSLIAGGFTKFFPYFIIPFLIVQLYAKGMKHEALYGLVLSALGGLASVAFPVMIFPNYFGMLKGKLNDIMRSDNYAIVSYVARVLIKSDETRLLLLNANQFLFALAFLVSLVWFSRNWERSVNAYIIPNALLLALPLNGFLWPDYHIWVCAPILMVPDIDFMRVFYAFLAPEYLVRMGNWGPEIYKPSFYNLAGISIIVLNLVILFLCLRKQGREKIDSDISQRVWIKEMVIYISLQALAIAILMFLFR